MPLKQINVYLMSSLSPFILITLILKCSVLLQNHVYKNLASLYGYEILFLFIVFLILFFFNSLVIHDGICTGGRRRPTIHGELAERLWHECLYHHGVPLRFLAHCLLVSRRTEGNNIFTSHETFIAVAVDPATGVLSSRSFLNTRCLRMHECPTRVYIS